MSPKLTRGGKTRGAASNEDSKADLLFGDVHRMRFAEDDEEGDDDEDDHDEEDDEEERDDCDDDEEDSADDDDDELYE